MSYVKTRVANQMKTETMNSQVTGKYLDIYKQLVERERQKSREQASPDSLSLENFPRS